MAFGNFSLDTRTAHPTLARSAPEAPKEVTAVNSIHKTTVRIPSGLCLPSYGRAFGMSVAVAATTRIPGTLAWRPPS